jgi:uncharacterized glyoxalase superfamily protein PhnB
MDIACTITPHLVCRHAAEAIAFYRQAFGAVELFRLTGEDARLQQARIRIGDSELLLVDEFPERALHGPHSLGGSAVILQLQVTDVDAAVARALAAGAVLTQAADDMYWGERYARVQDPFGHQWALACRRRQLSPTQLASAATPPDGDD